MKNYNVRNTNSDSKTDRRASKQKRLQGPLPLHRLGDKEKITNQAKLPKRPQK
jgi:hypothetical protein